MRSPILTCCAVLLPLVSGCAVDGTTSSTNTNTTAETLQPISVSTDAPKPTKNSTPGDTSTLYVIRTSSKVLANEEERKSGLGKKLVFAAILLGGAASNANVSVSSNNQKISYHLYGIENESSLNPIADVQTSSMPFQLEVPSEEESRFLMGTFRNQLFQSKYIPDDFARLSYLPTQGQAEVLVLGPHEGNEGVGMRIIQLDKRDEGYCLGLANSKASKGVLLNKMRDYSSRFLGTETKLKYSENFMVACDAIRKSRFENANELWDPLRFGESNNADKYVNKMKVKYDELISLDDETLSKKYKIDPVSTIPIQLAQGDK